MRSFLPQFLLKIYSWLIFLAEHRNLLCHPQQCVVCSNAEQQCAFMLRFGTGIKISQVALVRLLSRSFDKKAPQIGVQSSILNTGYWSLKKEKYAYSVASIYIVTAINKLSEGVFFTVPPLRKLTGAGKSWRGLMQQTKLFCEPHYLFQMFTVVLESAISG